MKNKRKFKRFELPLSVKFRPTYGATEYSTGVTTNLSIGGFGLEAHDFSFIVYEHLELIVDLPGTENPLPLFGDVVWKRQAGKRCLAGIEFRMKDKSVQKEAIEKISMSSNIPLAAICSHDDMIHEKAQKTSLSQLPDKLGIVKQYYEGGSKCKVTFRLLRETAGGAQNVTIVGDFNNWDTSESEMVRLENGDFIITMDLDSKREYRFRYLLDGDRWENDWYADRYARDDSGSKASVVIL